ncbi:MAG: hypothetical protein R3Y64_11030 [Peptostreptococcaceae bacterium]
MTLLTAIGVVGKNIFNFFLLIHFFRVFLEYLISREKVKLVKNYENYRDVDIDRCIDEIIDKCIEEKLSELEGEGD